LIGFQPISERAACRLSIKKKKREERCTSNFVNTKHVDIKQTRLQRIHARLDKLDNSLLSSTDKQMEAKINDLKEFSQKANMKINVSKTVLMSPQRAKQPSFKISIENVKEVEKFCYLGSMLTTTGGAIEDVKVRIRKAEAISHVKIFVICILLE
jgi:hypothetical protein